MTRLKGFYNVTEYGALANGSDDSAAFIAALAACYAGGGGAVVAQPGTYRIDSQLVIPCDNTSIPLQPPVHLMGFGGHFSGQPFPATSTPLTGGTVLDLRYAGAGAKIVTFGLGLLEMSGLTLTDTVGAADTAFLLATGTTLLIHGNGFVGTRRTTLCDQDAILLGGVNAVNTGKNYTNGFSGFGSVIRTNHFNGVRRAVFGRRWCNGVKVSENNIALGCGSNLANGAAIELDGQTVAGDACSGNLIQANTLESGNYTYGIKLTNAMWNSLIGNSSWDGLATAVRFEATATDNLLIPAYSQGPQVSDAGARNRQL